MNDSTEFLRAAVGADTPDTATLRDGLQTLADRAGGTYQINQHEGGQLLVITVPGRGSVQVDLDEGDSDPRQVIEVLTAKLTDRGLLGGTKKPFNLTFGDGKTITIYAVDEAQAVRLAGRGQPEKIEPGWPA